MPPGLATVTETVPVPAGATALIAVSLRMVNEAGLAPKNTLEAVVNPVPPRVTLLSPAIGPLDGDMLSRVGAVSYVKLAPLLVAEVVVAVTDTAPAVPAGAVAVMLLSELTVKAVAGVAPKYTSRALNNPAPVIVTVVPPLVGPAVGVIELMTGAGWKLKLCELSVPPEPVILTGTVLARCAGVTASTSESLTTVKLVAGVVPKLTPVVPVSPVPVILTVSPPATTPAVGKISEVVGAAI